MATICPLCGSSVEEGEVCSCQKELQMIAGEAANQNMDTAWADMPAFDIGTPDTAPPPAPVVEEEYAPLERLGDVPEPKPIAPLMPENQGVDGTVPYMGASENLPNTESVPSVDSLPTTEPVYAMDAVPITEAQEGMDVLSDVSILEPNVTEPPAPTLVYEQKEEAGVVYNAGQPQQAETAVPYSTTLEASDVEDYTVQTQLMDAQPEAVPPTVNSVFAAAGTGPVLDGQNGQQTETVSYTERYKEQDRIIREMAGLPPIEEEPEPEPVQEEMRGAYAENGAIARELPPCPEKPADLLADARVDPVTTAMRFVASGKQLPAVLLIALHALVMGLFTAVFCKRLSAIYGYSLSFDTFSGGKFLLALLIGIVISVGIHIGMSAAMSFVAQEHSAQAELPVLMRAAAMHALPMLPFLILGILISFINPVFSLPVIFIGYGIGCSLMGFCLEGMKDIEHDNVLVPLFVGILVSAIGMVLLFVLAGIIVF